MKEKHHLALFADEDEQARFEFIKTRNRLKKDADVMRFALSYTSDALGFATPANVPDGSEKKANKEGKG